MCDECALSSCQAAPGDALLCLFCAFVLDRLLFSAVVFGCQKRQLFVIVAFHGGMSAVFGCGGSLPGCHEREQWI